MKNLVITSDKFRVNLPLKTKNNLIGGNSGTGKTFLIELLSSINEEGLDRKRFKSNFDLSKIYTISTRGELNGFDFSKSGMIVFIDRGDYILEYRDYIKINKSKNIFFICSRVGSEEIPIDLKIESFLTLNYSVKDGIISFKATQLI